MSATGYRFNSYSTTNSNVATVSGTVITAKSANSVTIHSNWYASTPWVTNGFGNYSGWSGSSRRLQMSNGGSNMTYFIYNTGASFSWPNNSWASQYPSGWTTGYQDGWHGSSGYIAFKACGSGNNYNGTNRCGDATYTWIGADTSRAKTERWTQASGTWVVSNWSGGCSSLGTHRHSYTGSYAWRNSWESGKAHWNNYFLYCNTTASGGNGSVDNTGGKFEWAWWNYNCQGVDFKPSLSNWYEWWGINRTHCVHTGAVTDWQQ